LAVLTLLTLAGGTITARTRPFGNLSRYVQAFSCTGTLLFHSIPAVTHGLPRPPAGDPVLTSIEDPVLKMCYLVLLVEFLVGVRLQFH
jgi:hypothetical protein